MSFVATKPTPICHKFLKGKCYGACKYRHELPNLGSESTSSYSETSLNKGKYNQGLSYSSSDPNQTHKHSPYHVKSKPKYQGPKSKHNKHNKHGGNNKHGRHNEGNSNCNNDGKKGNLIPNYLKKDKRNTSHPITQIPSHSQSSINGSNYRSLCLNSCEHPLYVMYIGEFKDDEHNVCIKHGNAVADSYELAMPINDVAIITWYSTLKFTDGLQFNSTVIPNNNNTELSTILFTFMLRNSNAYLYHMINPKTKKQSPPDHTEWCAHLFKRFCRNLPSNIDNVKFEHFKDLYDFTIFKMYACSLLSIIELQYYMHHMMSLHWAIRSFCISNNILIPPRVDIDNIRRKCITGAYY